jgi:hypothetical protein
LASRDELITELIRDAYRSLADTVRDTPDLHELARVIRDWARADPQRYFLIHGTPAPATTRRRTSPPSPTRS